MVLTREDVILGFCLVDKRTLNKRYIMYQKSKTIDKGKVECLLPFLVCISFVLLAL